MRLSQGGLSGHSQRVDWQRMEGEETGTGGQTEKKPEPVEYPRDAH